MSIILQYAQKHNMDQINLHLGCGGHRIPGWINIDNFDYEANDSSRSGSNYDIKMDIRNLRIEDETIDSILLVHVVEHFVRWEAIKMFQHYFHKLKPNGKLIMEHPDLDKCIEWYLKGKEAPHINTPIGNLNMGFTQFYGNQWDRLDYETHRYVWTKTEIKSVLENIGYKIEHLTNDAKFHKKDRDMFVVAIKL